MSEPWMGASGAPSVAAYTVTPHDSTALTPIPRGLYVGGEGDVVVTLADDSVAVTFTAVPAGTLLPIRPKLVKATGTTATAIVALL